MDWYYVKDGDKRGPVSAETIREMAYQGVLQKHDLVWRPGLGDWIRADQADGVLSPPQIPTSRESTGLEEDRRESTQNKPVRETVQKDPRGTPKRQQQPTRVLKSEKAEPPQSLPSPRGKTKRGEAWLWFYTNIVLPGFLILGVIGAGLEAHNGNLTLTVARVVMFVLTGVVLMGMKEREHWAWVSNLLFLFFVTVLTAMISAARSSEGFPFFVGGLIGATLLIFLPNVVYFVKRRHLYSITERDYYVLPVLILVLFGLLLFYLGLFTSWLT